MVTGWSRLRNGLMVKSIQATEGKSIFSEDNVELLAVFFVCIKSCRALKGLVCEWQKDLLEKPGSSMPFGKGDLPWQPFSAPQRHMLCEIKRVPLKHTPTDELFQRSFYFYSIHTIETAFISCAVWSNASLQTSRRSFRRNITSNLFAYCVNLVSWN